MSEEPKGKTPAEIAWNRLSACFSPPEVADLAAFRREFIAAISSIDSEMVTQGVSDMISTRKHKTFPTIGDVRDACLSHAPRRQSAAYVDMGKVYAEQDGRRAAALKAMADMPRIDDVIAKGYHSALLDWIVAHDAMPTKADWAVIIDQAEQANALMKEADDRVQPPGSDGTFLHITRTAAEALRFRRSKIATDINALRMKEAAE